MYGRKVKGGLSQAELEEARLGFIQYLRRKRFSPQFIAAHGEDLFATAALEYSRKLAQGERIESPAGWLITCAWRRTMSLLEAQGRSPQVLPTERAELLEDELGRSPEQAAIEEDRLRRVQEAVDQLPAEERRLLELAYFEEMPVREVARELDWHPSKAQRRHEAAREHLHALLGVDSLDELEVIVGLAAYVSFTEGSSSWYPTAALEATANTLGRGVEAVWAKAQELARRLPVGTGGDTPTAAALGGAGRVAGACATAVIACLASGVVGPGVGGVNLIGGGAGKSRQQKPQRLADGRADTVRGGARAAVVPSALIPPAQSVPKPENRADGAKPTTSADARHRQKATEAVRSQSLESTATGPEEESSAPAEATSASYTSPPAEPSSGGSGAGPTQVANEQFGP
jgi:RNA polymerase sigma factor (sigma-70 family)